jgi:hypothetical protein
MKGFPNQVAELSTLTEALKVIASVIGAGRNAKDDGVLGEALIRQGVLGTGHTPIPVDEYLRQQRAKPKKSDQSYRTRARGLRELFRVLGLIDDSGSSVVLTPAGRQIIALPSPIGEAGLRNWRTAIVNMTHDGGDGEESHPYQVLLRLVARKPGITRAKCALALEPRNDSDEELNRIVALVDQGEDAIMRAIRISKPNWDNAKKVLPKFAEQLGDVNKVGQEFYLNDAPGVRTPAAAPAPPAPTPPARPPTAPAAPAAGPRRPRSASAVNSTTIATAGTAETFDEGADLDTTALDPAAIAEQRERLRARLRRHNLLIQSVARTLEAQGAELFENPFDCLACFPTEGLLIEGKTLDGTEADEVARVREALAQLLYYESFVTRPLTQERATKKVAYFEAKVSDDHIAWLERNSICVIWNEGDRLNASEHSRRELRGYFGF